VRLPADPSKLSDYDIVRLLEQDIEDEANWDVRNNCPLPLQWLGAPGEAYWDRRFPVSYSEERVIAMGATVIDPLIRLVASNDDPRIVTKAAYVLAHFDDPRILPAFYQAAKCGRVSPSDLQWLLEIHLPVGPLTTGVNDADVIKWLGDRADQDYSVLRLALLDIVVTAEYKDGGIYAGVADRRIIRWLNRIYDDDLDECLARLAPGALAFRNGELKKGYDPIALQRLAARLNGSNKDEGIKAVYSDLQTQAACHELLELVDALIMGGEPSLGRDGWQDRLRAWYREHRDQLVYDFEKHRFVVKDSPATQVRSERGRE
jgi:hypothetical protein